MVLEVTVPKEARLTLSTVKPNPSFNPDPLRQAL